MKMQEWKIKTTEIVHNGKTYRATDLQSIADLVEKLMFHPIQGERTTSEYEVDISLFKLEFCFPRKYIFNVSVTLCLATDFYASAVLFHSQEARNCNIWRPVYIEFKMGKTRGGRAQAEKYCHQLKSAIAISMLLEHIEDQYDIVLVHDDELDHIIARHKAQLVAERNKNE